ILYNLIDNAIKFTDHGSVVVAARHEQHQVWMSVSDTGNGIAPENIEAIFAPSEPMENHTEPQYGGTGLGLAVTRQLVELHGGQIRVESEAGQGATFSFSLPCTDSVAPSVAQDAPEIDREIPNRQLSNPLADRY